MLFEPANDTHIGQPSRASATECDADARSPFVWLPFLGVHADAKRDGHDEHDRDDYEAAAGIRTGRRHVEEGIRPRLWTFESSREGPLRRASYPSLPATPCHSPVHLSFTHRQSLERPEISGITRPVGVKMRARRIAGEPGVLNLQRDRQFLSCAGHLCRLAHDVLSRGEYVEVGERSLCVAHRVLAAGRHS
jgi:hypothetical protein